MKKLHTKKVWKITNQNGVATLPWDVASADMNRPWDPSILKYSRSGPPTCSQGYADRELETFWRSTCYSARASNDIPVTKLRRSHSLATGLGIHEDGRIPWNARRQPPEKQGSRTHKGAIEMLEKIGPHSKCLCHIMPCLGGKHVVPSAVGPNIMKCECLLTFHIMNKSRSLCQQRIKSQLGDICDSTN